MNDKFSPHNNSSAGQLAAREKLYDLFASRPMSDVKLLTNLGLFFRASALAKILFLEEIYKRVLTIPGDIYVFGV